MLCFSIFSALGVVGYTFNISTWKARQVDLCESKATLAT